MRNIFFDLCAIPVYLLILCTCALRKITKDHASRIFIQMNIVALVCTILDVCMEFVVNPTPISISAVVAGNLISYAYLALRNSTLVLYLIFIFASTRTEYLIRPKPVRILMWVPHGVLIVTLLLNIFNHNVFTVTLDNGYARGPGMPVIYCIAALYGVVGTIYCIYGKRYMTVGKWISLISVYALTYLAVFVQLFIPNLLVEMFSTAVGLLMIMLFVMRPEESLDMGTSIHSYKAYQADLRNTLLSGQHVQIVIVHQPNASKIRTYLGEDDYNTYTTEIADEIQKVYNAINVHIDMYFERPGTIYLIIEDRRVDVPSLVPGFLEATRKRVQSYADRGVRFSPKICVLKCPEDLKVYQDIINLGHRFPQLGGHEQVLFIGEDLVAEPNYNVINHMDEILTRAITERGIVMYYQPIYNVKEGRFSSAEALSRLMDREYGMIPPGLFIPAAEKSGLMIPVGDIVLDSVFKFISEHDLASLGLSYIEINLSVAQCLQADLPDIILRLQNRYHVDPHQVNFEITETMFDNLSGVMDRNLLKLAEMGYTFSLDDYGVGYSNIQRLRSLPLSIIKIDKSMVDDMFSEEGEVIIENTVRMMQGIHKELVVEGVESKAARDACRDLACDYIQGFYFSKPLPAEEFVAFLKAQQNNP